MQNIASNPEILCQKLIELNKEYLIQDFNYNNKNEIKSQCSVNLDKLKSENKFALNSVKREIKELIEVTNKNNNRYKIFCMKISHYLDSEDCLKDFKEPVENEGNNTYSYLRLFQKSDTKTVKNILKFLKNITLLSLYFSQYQFQYNLLSFKEVKDLLGLNIDKNLIGSQEIEAASLCKKLCQKLKRNESILEDKKDLKKIQIYCINLSIYNILSDQYLESNKKELFEFYQFINFLRDIDFCIKLYLFNNYSKFNNKSHHFYNDIHSSLFTSDIRLQIFTIYLGRAKYKEFNEKNINEINDSFKVKDYLIIGNELFKEKIKSIERDLKAESIKYLQIEQISHYINTKNEKDKNKAGNKNLIVYYYYLIITLKEFQENIEKILLLSAEHGITFFVLLYIEDEENKIIYHKNGISFILPIILVYSPEDIIKYISKIPDFEIPADEDDEIFNDLLNIKIPKISFRHDNEDDYQDGCFELAETFDTKIIKDKIVINYYGSILYNENIFKNIYLTYKEHNALDLFYKQNGIYFGTPLNSEFSCLDICFIKRILYMYCREEIDSKKSL